MNDAQKKMVGLFDKNIDGKGAKIHAADCNMLKTAGKRYARFDATEAELEDLRERGWPVVFCKCTK